MMRVPMSRAVMDPNAQISSAPIAMSAATVMGGPFCWGRVVTAFPKGLTRGFGVEARAGYSMV